MPALIMSAVPAHEKASANGFDSLTRSVSIAASAAVIGTVVASMAQNIGGQTIATPTGFIGSLLIGCSGAIIAAIIASTIPTTVRVASSS